MQAAFALLSNGALITVLWVILLGVLPLATGILLLRESFQTRKNAGWNFFLGLACLLVAFGFGACMVIVSFLF